MAGESGSMKSLGRITALVLTLILFVALFPAGSQAIAGGDQDELQDESNRISYELLQLRTRRKAAAGESESPRGGLQALDNEIGRAEAYLNDLEEELRAFQESYGLSMRTLYKMGNMTALEIFLDAEELNDAWQDNAVYQRLLARDGEEIEKIKSKLADLDTRKRDLKEARERRTRVAETLDIDRLDGQISLLEVRLSEVNNKLRSLSTGAGNETGGGEGRNQAPSWKAPAAGEVLDRVTRQPSLSDFELTGMVMAGYTTCYGEEFDGDPTASGVIFHMYDFTCAHRSFPFGTWLLVKYNGGHVIVQVNDRGPFVPGRVLDLSFGAARSIGLDGVQWTEFEIIVPKGTATK